MILKAVVMNMLELKTLLLNIINCLQGSFTYSRKPYYTYQLYLSFQELLEAKEA
jgi:hypothetical protein